MFLHGKAAFLRSWTSAYAKLKQARIPFEVAPLPRGKSDRSFGVVGGWQLAVPKKSPNKPSAIEFIRYLSSPGVQRWRAREGAYQPTMQKLDEELDVANALPRVNMKDIQPIIRPSSQLGDRYDEVSKCIYNSVRAALDSKSRHEIKQYIVNMKNCVESNEPPKVDR